MKFNGSLNLDAKQVVLYIMLILFSYSCSSSSLPGSGIEVNMGKANWDTGWFQAEIYRQLLLELGYDVEEANIVDNVAFYTIAAQGDIDFWVNGWFPLHDVYFEMENISENLIIVGSEVISGGLQGYLIDKDSADKFGINNLADFSDPEIAAHFDMNGDGTADLIGCNAQWSCSKVINHHLTEYTLNSRITHIQGEYSELIIEVFDRYESGAPIFFYSWTPNWTLAELKPGEDVVWLSVPFSSLPFENNADTSFSFISGCVATPCDLGFGLNDIKAVANRDFLENHPVIYTLLELVEIPVEDISGQNVAMFNGENEQADIENQALQWISDNREIVDSWISEAINSAESKN